jgi:hypothetical protein
MRHLLMRVFSNSFGHRCTLGRSWAVEEAQEQVDRDTLVSRTPTYPYTQTQIRESLYDGLGTWSMILLDTISYGVFKTSTDHASFIMVNLFGNLGGTKKDRERDKIEEYLDSTIKKAR